MSDIDLMVKALEAATAALSGNPCDAIGHCWWCGEQAAGAPRKRAGGGYWPIGHAVDCQWVRFQEAAARLVPRQWPTNRDGTPDEDVTLPRGDAVAEVYCPCARQCHETLHPCSFSCVAHHSKEERGA